MIPFLCGLFLCANSFAAQYRAALVADMDTGRVLYQENDCISNMTNSNQL